MNTKIKCQRVCNTKVFFGCFNVIFFLCGFGSVVVGFLLLCDSNRILLSTLVTADPGLEQPAFYYLALGFVALGLLICAGGALGCWATYAPGYIVLTLYFVVVLGALVVECGACVVVAMWPGCVGLGARVGGLGALGGARAGSMGGLGGAGASVLGLQERYGVPGNEQYTAAVDLAQTQFQCCGLRDTGSYKGSAWRTRRLGPQELVVPLTCCVQDDPSYLDPRPINLTRCQDPSADEQYRHQQGCQARLEEWYHCHYITFLAIMAAMAFWKFGVLLSTVLACSSVRRRRRHKSIFNIRENNTNESIYQQKIMTLQDQPILPKYVQPNNFYSPRTRNPRIFHTKPNDMA